MIVDQIIRLLPETACDSGLNDILNHNENLPNLFFKYIDFCLANEYPDKKTIKQVPNHLESGIVIDRKLSRTNPERLALLGKCDMDVHCNGFSVTRIYVKHESKLFITASDNAFVLIDALDHSQIHCKMNDSARIIVNRFSGAYVNNATKIIEKKRITYDLQIR